MAAERRMLKMASTTSLYPVCEAVCLYRQGEVWLLIRNEWKHL